MTDDIFDEMEDDFDDDMSDILEESQDEPQDGESEKTQEKEDVQKPSIITRMISIQKGLLKKLLGSTRSIIIFSIGVVVFICLILLVWIFVFQSDSDRILQPRPDVVKGEIQGEPAGGEKILFEDIVELEPFERIALKTSSTMSKLSMNLSLELTDARYRKQIYAMEDQIRTIVTGQVGNATWLELRSPEGKIMLKYNLLQRINALFPKATVRNIYFTYFIMQ